MISYDVIGDYMSDLDDVRKRIEKRKRPLNDHNFKKLYNGVKRCGFAGSGSAGQHQNAAFKRLGYGFAL